MSKESVYPRAIQKLSGIAIILLLFCSCHSTNKNTTLFTAIPADRSGLHFINHVADSDTLNIFNYRNFYNGGGVAIGDINNDGLADIFLTGNISPNKLFINKGHFEFEDITGKSFAKRSIKWSTGVVMVDINNDGWLDIYVCNAGYLPGDSRENELFINNHDLTFTEQAAAYGLNNKGYTTHAAFFDYDLDGDLDAYILNNSFIPVNTLNLSDRRDLPASEWPVKDFLKNGGDQFLRNDNGHFVDITQQAGIYSSLIGFGLGVTVGDVNHDRWPDIYVSNDFYERDYLYINNRDGTFTEDIMNRMDHISLSSMGADMADINNDGYPEIFTTDMLPDDDVRLRSTTTFESYSVYLIKQQRNFHHQYTQNTLQLNRGDGTFAEVANYAGVAASDWSWGGLIFDMDLDGLKDIYVCNGIQRDVTDQDFIDFFADEVIQRMVLTGKKEEMKNVLNKMPSNPIQNKIFRNKGDLKFEDVSTTWAPGVRSFSNGAAYGDLDNDGDLDLVVNNVNMEAFLYRNNEQENEDHHFLSVRLIGKSPNTFAIGATLRAYADHQIFTAEIMPSRGFQSSVDYTSILGLGTVQAVDSLVIQWPGFARTRLASPETDTLLIIHQPEDIIRDTAISLIQYPALLHAESSSFLPHTEDHYVDFYEEGLLMHKLSNEGPAYVRGDINGDHVDDIIVGGAANQATMVYLGGNQGWNQLANTGLEHEADFEDVAAILADLDMDGDSDLVIGSGGSLDMPQSRLLQDRVYLNDGSGHFSLSPNALPPNGYNTAAIGSDDVDMDGDQDLIVCSRSVPGNYGPSPPSYVYVNDGHANFKIATKEIAPELMFAGMVTGLCIADITGDHRREWIVIREWGAPLILENKNGRYEPLQSNLSDYSGWWCAIEVADLNQDGKADLILGNRGENFYFSGQSTDHYKLWISDFDQNGTIENVITRTIAGKDVPVPMKKELTDQMPFLKKLNLKHKDYASRCLQDMIPADRLKKAMVLTADYHASIVAWNKGDGQFTIEKLPTEVQLSCATAIVVHDVNQDNRPDLIIGGNNYSFLPQFSRLDASTGTIIMNQTDNHLETIDRQHTGWVIHGEVKHIDVFTTGQKTYLLSIFNNEAPSLYSFDQKETF